MHGWMDGWMDGQIYMIQLIILDLSQLSWCRSNIALFMAEYGRYVYSIHGVYKPTNIKFTFRAAPRKVSAQALLFNRCLTSPRSPKKWYRTTFSEGLICQLRDWAVASFHDVPCGHTKRDKGQFLWGDSYHGPPRVAKETTKKEVEKLRVKSSRAE